MKSKFLAKLLAARQNRVTELKEAIKTATTADEVRSLGAELDGVNAEIREIQAEIDAQTDGSDGSPDSRSATPAVPEARGLNPVAGFTTKPVGEARNTDPYDTPEYRNAYMNYVCRGVPIPAELRQDQNTTTADASAVIPTSLQNEIIRKAESYGDLYAKFRKTNIPGGVEYPIADLIPTATWITEGTKTDDQKLQANSKVSFNYYGLECKISQSQLASVVTYDAFQALFSTLAVEAIVKALEKGSMQGTGSGQMLGVTKDSRVPAANIITLKAADMTWANLKKKVFAKIPKAYRNGEFIMAQSTFDGYIDGMVDSNGQPIGRVNYGIDGGETYRFGGKVVNTVEEDVLPGFESASANDVFAVFMRPGDYCINSNMALTVVRWVDNDNNKVKTKATVIVDGKLLDPNGVILLKKGTE